MTKEEKNIQIDLLVKDSESNPNFYLTDTSALNAELTSKLRRQCFQSNITMKVVKNSLLKKALEKIGKEDFKDMYPVLKGNTAIMFCEVSNGPAKLIKEFRVKNTKPLVKLAYVESSLYIGDSQLDALVALKSKNELIGDVIMLLQSPAKNVISALKSGNNKLSGILKTLSEKN